jgi:hypothetical protein
MDQDLSKQEKRRSGVKDLKKNKYKPSLQVVVVVGRSKRDLAGVSSNKICERQTYQLD